MAPATSASAEVETFIRFEEKATANWLVTEQCPDGTTTQTRVSVIVGRELESPDLDDVNRFGTVLIRGFDCDGNFVSARGSGPVTYSSSPSLREAHVAGTVRLNTGGTATIDVTWEGTGGIETTVNQTQFAGSSASSPPSDETPSPPGPSWWTARRSCPGQPRARRSRPWRTATGPCLPATSDRAHPVSVRLAG